MEEAEEIARLRHQRSQLRSQLESRKRRNSELFGSLAATVPGFEGYAAPPPDYPYGDFDSGPSYAPPPPPQGQPGPVQGAPAHPRAGEAAPGPKGGGGQRGADKYGAGTPMHVVQGMVLDCIVSNELELPVESTAIARRIKRNAHLTPRENAALAKVGGPGDAILEAVEAAICKMAEGPKALMEAEDFAVSGITRKMVLSLDRRKIVEVFPHLFGAKDGAAARAEQDPLRGHHAWDPHENATGQFGVPPTFGPSGEGPPFPFNGPHGLHARPQSGYHDQNGMWVPHAGGPHAPAGPRPGFHGEFGSWGPPGGDHRRPQGRNSGYYDQHGMWVPQGGGPGGVPFQSFEGGLHRGPHGGPAGPPTGVDKKGGKAPSQLMGSGEENPEAFLEAILSKKSFKEAQQTKKGEELMELLQKPTAKEAAQAAKFKSKGGSMVKEYCSHLTREDCNPHLLPMTVCDKVHFRRIILPHTDPQLGDCSFLDTCRHMKTCKYVHYEVDPTSDPATLTMMMKAHQPPSIPGAVPMLPTEMNPFHPPSRFDRPPRPEYCSPAEMGASQWINCDIRTFEMDMLGKFGVVMADPPWDIHMDLPYGTMADDEMRALKVQNLQTDGLIFLWVTGRAMELGRECLELWGYKRVEEIIWVKTNQLQRVIRTGRTGHWLNHSKEHCLVGIKGDPIINRNIDTDVLVAEVRETSRKPDEMYSLIERISPRTRKVELFARMHNTHAGWMSLGNQLNGVRLVDPDLRKRFRDKHPGVEIQPSDEELRQGTF